MIVIDANSTDATVDKVRQAQAGMDIPLHLEVAQQRISVGEARNRAVQLAQAPHVAFISADTEIDERWTAEALASLETADMVFSRQVHDPDTWTLAAAVRGLRYHFPEEETEEPLTYASNVAAAYDKQILAEFPIDPDVVAVDDLLLAERASAAGWEATYNPDLVVYHRDVITIGQEWSKNLREGRGWGLNTSELGPMVATVVWGLALVAAIGLLLVPAGLLAIPSGLEVALLLGILWAPALRRGIHRAGKMPPGVLAMGVLASPLFDLAFLLSYVRGLLEADDDHLSADPEGIDR